MRQGVVEHLLPLQARIGHDGPVVDLDAGLGQIRRRLGAGVDEQHLARAGGGGGAVEHVLAVVGETEVAHVRDEHFRLRRGAADRQRLQRALAAAVAFEQVEALVVDRHRAVVARCERHFVQALAQARVLHRRQLRLLLFRLGRGLGVGHRGRHYLLGDRDGVGRFAVGGRLLFRLGQFVVRLEREARAGLQRQREHADALVEYRAHIAVGPDRTVTDVEVARRQEVQPLPVRREGRRAGGVAVGGDEGQVAGVEVVHADLVALLGAAGADEGDVAAVRRPHYLVGAFEADLAGIVDHDVLAAREFEQPGAAVLVGVGDPFAVRGRVQRPAVVAGAVAGELLAVAGTVGGVAPDLVLAAAVDDGVDGFVVVAEHGAAGAGAFRHRDLDAALAVQAGDRDVAARGEHDALRLVGDLDVGERVQRRADQARALLVEVGHQAGLEQAVAAGGDVEHVQVCAELVDDASVAERRAAHVPVLVLGELFAVAAVRVGRPQVVAAGGVADEVEAALPPHRAAVVAGVVREQQFGFALGAQLETPQLGVGAAAVVLHVVAGHGEAHAREVDGAAGVVEHGVVGVGQRQHAARHVLRVDRGDHAVARGSGGIFGADQDFALRGPAQHQHIAVLEGQALGQAAVERHHVGFLRALIRGGEGDQLAVEGERGVGFGGRVGGQALGLAAGDRGAPEVALGGEHHGVAADGGEAEVGVGGRGVGGSEGGGQGENGLMQFHFRCGNSCKGGSLPQGTEAEGGKFMHMSGCSAAVTAIVETSSPRRRGSMLSWLVGCVSSFDAQAVYGSPPARGRRYLLRWQCEKKPRTRR
ncbi:hypothetical protein, partial [Massilia terrae]